jgi:16S rRNA (guanine527-N7)-methyltransferase
MAALTTDQITVLLGDYYPEPSELLLEQLSAYLDLLLKWNQRTNLTAIRDPEEIVRRHFGESLFVAAHLPECETLLDLGSGAGFPGLPIQLARPKLQVTLAESQHKKASFLREAVRTLGVSTEVWGDRAESLERQFDVVALRAVDRPAEALAVAREKVRPGGTIAHLTGSAEGSGRIIPVPGADRSFLHLFHVEQSAPTAGNH